MERFGVSIYYTLVALVLLAIFYFVIKNRKIITSPVVTERTVVIVGTLRKIAIAGVIIWGISTSWTVSQEGGPGGIILFVFWPILLGFIIVMMMSWEKLLRRSPVFIYILLLIIILLYFTALTMLESLLFDGPALSI